MVFPHLLSMPRSTEDMQNTHTHTRPHLQPPPRIKMPPPGHPAALCTPAPRCGLGPGPLVTRGAAATPWTNHALLRGHGTLGAAPTCDKPTSTREMQQARSLLQERAGGQQPGARDSQVSVPPRDPTVTHKHGWRARKHLYCHAATQAAVWPSSQGHRGDYSAMLPMQPEHQPNTRT